MALQMRARYAGTMKHKREREETRWSFSSLFFTWPSVWNGIARLFSFGEPVRRRHVIELSRPDYDALAMRTDWATVSGDMWKAYDSFTADMRNMNPELARKIEVGIARYLEERAKSVQRELEHAPS